MSNSQSSSYTISMSGGGDVLNILQSTDLVVVSRLKNNENEDIANRSTGINREFVASSDDKSVLLDGDNAENSSVDNGQKSKRLMASAVRVRYKEHDRQINYMCRFAFVTEFSVDRCY